MDTLTGDFGRLDVVLTQEDTGGQELDTGDEVENLQNSLREAVHDDNIQPKMQCLMMDASFSMVTVQGEDSGIAWETSPSHCTTPWASEAGNVSADLSSPAATRPAMSGSLPAGRIIFVMDEELILKRKKAKERVSAQKSKADRQKELLLENEDDISGRPELVGFSQPNVKTEGEGEEEELTDPVEDKEQRLFSLVSEGSEILNIVVPPKFATVDEEESKVMMDNLSYLEETPVTKSTEETNERLFDLNNELVISTEAPTVSGAARGDQVMPSHRSPHVMDPPGAPVARSPGTGATSNVDYFEAFSLIDAQAPGSPAVTTQRQGQLEGEETREIHSIKKPVQPEEETAMMTSAVDEETTESTSMDEITSEHLDEVFYAGTDTYKNPEDNCEASKAFPSRLPSKESGSALFGSQEDILTPIYLPEGPPKIIDPILLEEPKAMAFLYTDLYEEAFGSRLKEEDTESLTSEKSFHSRHSDREARGYLEKYVLIDETPVLEAKPTHVENCEKEEGQQMLSPDLYDDFLSKPDMGEMPKSEEDLTDFFRCCDNSSPYDIDPFPQSLEEDEAEPMTKSKAKTQKNVSIAVEKVVENPVDPVSASSFEVSSDEPDWGSAVDDFISMDEKEDSMHTDQELWKQDLERQSPVAPPRRKATSCLDLMPLTPAEIAEEDKRKEERVEEKETASPAEINEGDVISDENEPETCDSSSVEDGIADVFGDLAALPVEVGERRPTCLRCRRPQKVCLCPFLPPQPLEVSTCLYVVQHPAEESRVLRTVPLLAACLPPGKCNVIVGRKFNEEKHPDLAAVCQDSRTLILYPGPKAQNLEELVQHQEVGSVKHNVIIIDGTWSQAKNMFLKNSLLHLPKQVQLNRTLSSQYVIRTQPSNICLSTLECAAVALSILERNDDIQEVLLRPLRALCSFQLQHGAQIHHSKEHLLKNGMYDKPMPKNKRKIKRMEKLVADRNICPR
ncbi:hypothetical protein LDENG_00161900 [Lucifuga dentata]|nr:hypothetical protein LDENG_00161900 [Lucifuga dentata]